MTGANTTSDHPCFSQLTTTINTSPSSMERGSRYKAYAALRESKLRLKSLSNPPPLPPKTTKSSAISTPPERRRRKVFSVLTQSVPDFSPKPSLLPRVAEKSATPPAKSSSRLYETNAKLTGSKSMNSREKKGDGMMSVRRSCVNMDELKKFSVVAANDINGENRGRVGGNRVGGRSTVFGSRQFY